MTNYQLAKLVQWAGTLKTRKGLQKLVYLLQAAGCPFQADYRLHHYGPYSDDVAAIADDLVRRGFLQEETVANAAGQQFNYSLTPKAEESLTKLEATPRGATSQAELAGFDSLARDLVRRDVRELELAATIVFFRQQGYEWPSAVEKACQFKPLARDKILLQKARTLAEHVSSR